MKQARVAPPSVAKKATKRVKRTMEGSGQKTEATGAKTPEKKEAQTSLDADPVYSSC